MMNNVQKTCSASPRTPKSTKRNLSTSSISPSQDDKKPKVYVSPNRFAMPATDDTNDLATTMPLTNLKDDSVNLPHTGQDLPAPPIHISSYSAAFN